MRSLTSMTRSTPSSKSSLRSCSNESGSASKSPGNYSSPPEPTPTASAPNPPSPCRPPPPPPQSEAPPRDNPRGGPLQDGDHPLLEAIPRPRGLLPPQPRHRTHRPEHETTPNRRLTLRRASKEPNKRPANDADGDREDGGHEPPVLLGHPARDVEAAA